MKKLILKIGSNIITCGIIFFCFLTIWCKDEKILRIGVWVFAVLIISLLIYKLFLIDKERLVIKILQLFLCLNLVISSILQMYNIINLSWYIWGSAIACLITHCIISLIPYIKAMRDGKLKLDDDDEPNGFYRKKF